MLIFPSNELNPGIQEKNQVLLGEEEVDSDQDTNARPSKKTKQSSFALSEEETDLLDALGQARQSSTPAVNPSIEIDENGLDNSKDNQTPSLTNSEPEDEEIHDDVDCESGIFMTNGVNFYFILKKFYVQSLFPRSLSIKRRRQAQFFIVNQQLDSAVLVVLIFLKRSVRWRAQLKSIFGSN